MIDLQLLLQLQNCYTTRYKYNTEHGALCCAGFECGVSDGRNQCPQPYYHNLQITLVEH